VKSIEYGTLIPDAKQICILGKVDENDLKIPKGISNLEYWKDHVFVGYVSYEVNLESIFEWNGNYFKLVKIHNDAWDEESKSIFKGFKAVCKFEPITPFPNEWINMPIQHSWTGQKKRKVWFHMILDDCTNQFLRDNKIDRIIS